ncbi:hypothetical protein [Propionivibrio sp.]|uniref:hypothetical protein n=1 Tax=Propionivibrio sp. TaxID=2212460 RepID=UPI0034246BFD
MDNTDTTPDKTDTLLIDGLAGNDTIRSLGGNDTISGGPRHRPERRSAGTFHGGRR